MLRRERRLLTRLREERLRDLGGLLLEMYRRDSFREQLLSERCADLVAIDTRLAEIQALLTGPRRSPRCACGARILPGSRFCASCGLQLAPPQQPAAAGGETRIDPPAMGAR